MIARPAGEMRARCSKIARFGVVKFVMFGPKDWNLWRISMAPRISFVIYKLARLVRLWAQLGHRKWPVLAGFPENPENQNEELLACSSLGTSDVVR